MQQVDGTIFGDDEIRIIAQVFRLGLRWLRSTDATRWPTAEALQPELERLAEEARSRALRESAKPAFIEIVAGSLTTAQAAAVIGVSEQRTRALCRSGEVVAVPSATGWRIDADSAATMAARRRGAG